MAINPIINTALWIACQLAANRRGGKSEHLLTGLLGQPRRMLKTPLSQLIDSFKAHRAVHLSSQIGALTADRHIDILTAL
jgi:hypothetical protein